MDKRGQFFLIAAVVIIGLIIGLSVVYNSVKAPKEDSQVYDLSKEIDYESAQVIDHGTFNALTETAVNAVIKQ